jgi:hypothetical protein
MNLLARYISDFNATYLQSRTDRRRTWREVVKFGAMVGVLLVVYFLMIWMEK